LALIELYIAISKRRREKENGMRNQEKKEQETYRLRLWNDSSEKEDNLEMFNTTTKAYSLDKTIDYFTVRSMVIQSLEKIVREELDRHIASNNLHELDIQEDEEDIIIAANTSSNLFDDHDDDNKLSASLLKLKIRNTTEYLNWRIAILKRDILPINVGNIFSQYGVC
jgi:hypothetical protein